MRQLTRVQVLPITPEEAWNFFSSPMNLNEICPEEMDFRVISEVRAQIYPGMIIRYKVAPFASISIGWVTEITHVQPGRYFVDEQRKGPYRIWHHEHHFEPHPGGVQMTDILHYDIGKGIFGSLAGALFVHRKVKGIFDYRFKKLEQLFPKKS